MNANLETATIEELRAELQRRTTPREYVVEGIWSGYVSSQSRPCHRTIVNRKLAESLAKITAVRYSDGTDMRLTVRQRKPREKVEIIDGYTGLLKKCADKGLTGFVNVDDAQ